MENLMNFIPENLMILVVVIYVVGIFLKKTDKIKDNYITVILMIFGITFAILLNIINSEYKVALDVIVNGILQGILCWGVAVGVNQTAKQLTREE
ncbi:phage holin family protein [Clostridium butyricum]|uniref:phage holin family protein n=1 Tax=Clostridium butyricum TaxID=1492 RepID=UPI002AB2CEF0|nr:phage holin family protein [Clostridium butyricum]